MSLKEKYERAMVAGDWDAAEQVLRQALPHAQDHHVHLLLANLLRKRGRLEEAERLLLPAAEVSAPTPDVLDLLSLVQYERQQFEACERTLSRLIDLTPIAPLASYKLLAKLKTRMGEQEAARSVMARGVTAHPGATDFVAAYADMLPPDHAVRELEKHLQAINFDPGRLAYILVRMTTHRAPEIRARSGLPNYGKSWSDTYQWADIQGLAKLKRALQREIDLGATRATALLDLACVHIAEGDWERAEDTLVRLRNGPKRTVADFSAFGRAFHGALDLMSDDGIAAELVPIEYLLSAPPQAEASIFIGCDQTYFDRFAIRFLREAEALGIPLDIHVHLLDGTAAEWMKARDELKTLSVVRPSLTAEASGAALSGTSYKRLYYHSVRYVRAFQEIRRSERPIFVFDADVKLLSDPRPLFSAFAGHDVALKTSPLQFSPNLKITASCVGLAPTPRGREFARRVAAYVVHWKKLKSWGWGVDQLGLLSAYAIMASKGREPRTLFLDDEAMNDKVGDTGMVKFLSGIDKYGVETNRLSGGGVGTK